MHATSRPGNQLWGGGRRKISLCLVSYLNLKYLGVGIQPISFSNIFLFWHSYSCPKKASWEKNTHYIFWSLSKKQLATIKRWRNLVRLEAPVNYHHSIILRFNFASSNLQDFVKLSAGDHEPSLVISTTAPMFEANKKNNYPAFFAGEPHLASRFLGEQSGRGPEVLTVHWYTVGAQRPAQARLPVWSVLQMRKPKCQHVKVSHPNTVRVTTQAPWFSDHVPFHCH